MYHVIHTIQYMKFTYLSIEILLLNVLTSTYNTDTDTWNCAAINCRHLA